jgi:hypothetical protein
VVAVVAWSAGCATAPPPIVDSAFASGAYAPTRIAVLPPDVFVVLDQVGENDPAQSAALGQALSEQTVRLVEQSLRARGYDVDLRARWDGIAGSDGSLLVTRDELGWLANGVLQFGNGLASGQAPAPGTGVVAPELAAKVGWATQSDALLYVNVKGVETTSGKRAESVLAGVFIVVIVAAIVLMLVANSKGGGGGSPSTLSGGGFRGQSVGRAPAPGFHGTPPGGGFRGTPPAGGGFRGAPPALSAGHAAAMPSGNAMTRASTGVSPTLPSGGRAPVPSGGGAPGASAWRNGAPPAPARGYVYDGRPHAGVSFGVGVVVPLDGPVYTHDGDVQHEDEMFAGDNLYVSMTLVSTYDGRVLWHERQELSLDADDPKDVDRMVQTFLTSLPPRGGFPAAPPPQK